MKLFFLILLCIITFPLGPLVWIIVKLMNNDDSNSK